MKVKDIKHSLECCFDDNSRCSECVMFGEADHVDNCQKRLVEAAIEKLDELVNLLDDKVNHHYYDTLEELQEQNTLLQDKLDKIEQILN